MPNRAIKEERETGRRKVGPADAATVRRELNKRLAEREPNRYGKGEKSDAKRKAKTPDQDTGNLSVFNVGRKLRARKQRMDEAS